MAPKKLEIRKFPDTEKATTKNTTKVFFLLPKYISLLSEKKKEHL